VIFTFVDLTGIGHNQIIKELELLQIISQLEMA